VGNDVGDSPEKEKKGGCVGNSVGSNLKRNKKGTQDFS
jgi:hypothetical protein